MLSYSIRAVGGAVSMARWHRQQGPVSVSVLKLILINIVFVFWLIPHCPIYPQNNNVLIGWNKNNLVVDILKYSEKNIPVIAAIEVDIFSYGAE